MTGVTDALADAHRREWAYVLAATVRVTRDLDLAEECVQDAYVAALRSWQRTGVPARPGAWLTTAARRRALDRLDHERGLRRRLPDLLVDAEHDGHGGTRSAEAAPDASGGLPDDRLRLIFTCCHPALSREAQVALTLRLVCGVDTASVARAFLVPEATMAARITRAKHKIAAARIPYRVPTAAELPERLGAVLSVVHLLFTVGHTAPRGQQLVREDLVVRAVDLARLLHVLLPGRAEATGLLALLVLTDARRATRVDADGQLVLLADQDRSRWDRAAIADGAALAGDAMASAEPGRYALQAAIAAEHARSMSYAGTDWVAVLDRYDRLLRAWPSPVVALNRAVALAEVAGPEAALAEVDALAGLPQLAGYPYLEATRADLLRRLGRYADAARSYALALQVADNAVEREFLARRRTEMLAAG